MGKQKRWLTKKVGGSGNGSPNRIPNWRKVCCESPRPNTGGKRRHSDYGGRQTAGDVHASETQPLIWIGGTRSPRTYTPAFHRSAPGLPHAGVPAESRAIHAEDTRGQRRGHCVLAEVVEGQGREQPVSSWMRHKRLNRSRVDKDRSGPGRMCPP